MYKTTKFEYFFITFKLSRHPTPHSRWCSSEREETFYETFSALSVKKERENLSQIIFVLQKRKTFTRRKFHGESGEDR